MEMPDPSPTRRLADLLLAEHGGLDQFVQSRRNQQPPRAWRLIARDLYEVTDTTIDVTYETVRSWFPDEAKAAS